MTITLEEAKDLKYGDILYHVYHRNADGTPRRWRVTGRVRTWKTRPNEVSVPIKYGLWCHDYLTHWELDLVCLTPEDAMDEFYERKVSEDVKATRKSFKR